MKRGFNLTSFNTLFSYEDKDFGRYWQIFKSAVVYLYTYFYTKKYNTFFSELKCKLNAGVKSIKAFQKMLHFFPDHASI